MKQGLTVLIIWAISGFAAGGDQGVTQRGSSTSRVRPLKLEELTWPQIDALDRQRTLFMLPVGMIEQHGPHLPVGSDTIAVMYEANEAAARLSRALPDWSVVMMPAINYGQSGANQLGNMPVHPGTYAIRQSTLRSLVVDVGGQIAQNGFKWIFVLNGHGAPTHNIAINEACDFVSETFRMTMLHLTGLFRGDTAIQSAGERINAKYFRAEELASFGMDVHDARVPETVPAAVAPILEKALAQEVAFGATLEDWLARRNQRTRLRGSRRPDNDLCVRTFWRHIYLQRSKWRGRLSSRPGGMPPSTGAFFCFLVREMTGTTRATGSSKRTVLAIRLRGGVSPKNELK